jgi:hypothetical protein
MRAFGTDERRTRLARRHFLASGSQARDPVQLAAGMVGLHATDPATVYLAARARVRGSAGPELERALYEERTLLRIIGMRRTLFVFPLDLAAVVQAACTESIAAAQRRRYAKLIEEGGVAKDGRRWLARAEAATLKALTARGEAFATELSSDVPQLRKKVHYGEGKAWAGSIGMTSWVLFLLAAEGRVVRGRPRGTWTSSQWSWVPAESWVEKPLARLEPEPARAQLASRWLQAFGPAGVDDLKWWTGWTLTQARAAIAAIEAVEVDLDGRTGFILPGDDENDPEVEPWAAFLPALDPTVMGWKERDWYLGEHRQALFDRAGNAGPTVWWNGRIVGGWSVRGEEIPFRLLEDVGADAVAAIEAEAARLGAWLGEVKVLPRFATPLAKELSG